jgi:lipid-binding SYLF domain-containing protein
MTNSRFAASILTAAVVAVALTSTGCATAPKTHAERQSLVAEADAAVQSMIAKDSSLRDFLDRAYGYAAFPNIGKAGLIAGGASGRGVVYENGRPIGYAQINQASVGAQIGAQAYSELIVFQNQAALDRIKAGDFDLGADVSAVALKAGAAKTAQFEGGMAVFVQPKGGLMAEASIKGQKITFEPMDESEAASARHPAPRPGGRSSGMSDGTSDGSRGVEVDVNTDRPRDNR